MITLVKNETPFDGVMQLQPERHTTEVVSFSKLLGTSSSCQQIVSMLAREPKRAAMAGERSMRPAVSTYLRRSHPISRSRKCSSCARPELAYPFAKAQS